MNYVTLISILLFHLPLYPAHAKCAQQSDVVFDIKENDQYLHIAWYIPNSYIITVLEGQDKGLQQIWLGSQMLLSSNESVIKNKYFIHFYDGFKVYSWDDYQRIIYTKDQGKIRCLEQKKDSSKS